MIIDSILDRMDGSEYNAAAFYRAACAYGEIGHDIARALDFGTEEDARRALRDYVDGGAYNGFIKDFIDAVNWIGSTPAAIETAARDRFKATEAARDAHRAKLGAAYAAGYKVQEHTEEALELSAVLKTRLYSTKNAGDVIEIETMQALPALPA